MGGVSGWNGVGADRWGVGEEWVEGGVGARGVVLAGGGWVGSGRCQWVGGWRRSPQLVIVKRRANGDYRTCGLGREAPGVTWTCGSGVGWRAGEWVDEGEDGGVDGRRRRRIRDGKGRGKRDSLQQKATEEVGRRPGRGRER